MPWVAYLEAGDSRVAPGVEVRKRMEREDARRERVTQEGAQ